MRVRLRHDVHTSFHRDKDEKLGCDSLQLTSTVEQLQQAKEALSQEYQGEASKMIVGGQVPTSGCKIFDNFFKGL